MLFVPTLSSKKVEDISTRIPDSNKPNNQEGLQRVCAMKGAVWKCNSCTKKLFICVIFFCDKSREL